MKQRIALLSNVNMNYTIRMLKNDYEVYETEGYGNELGLMLDGESSYQSFAPQVTFLVIDLMELLEHKLDGVGEKVEQWLDTLSRAVRDDRLYYVSDAYLWGPVLNVVHDTGTKSEIEALWRAGLNRLCREKTNVRVLPYHHMIEKMGEDSAFSLKLWYMGGILLTNEAQKKLCGLIAYKLDLLGRTARKVLLLDLDNTLWGGLAGEADHTEVSLGPDHLGLAYKNLQRVILKMQEQGVLLGIVSKNNEADAMKLLKHHPHNLLRPECFAAVRINWEPKHENIIQIAKELNLGLDSFVFWDDSEVERELVRQMLPQVTVPEFPQRPEELAGTMTKIYREYFEKDVLTAEDREKTRQYAANAGRKRLQQAAGDYESYLKELDIVISRADLKENEARLVQLVNKTNQFNLTGRRYETAEMQAVLADRDRRVWLYRVSDRFGDSGIVAAAVVNVAGADTMPYHAPEMEADLLPDNVSVNASGNVTEDVTQSRLPRLEVFVMSCRVMGRRIEYAIMEDMENRLWEEGYEGLAAQYVKTDKNMPVEMLFEKLGYKVTEVKADGSKEYRILGRNRPERQYFAKIINFS